MKKLNRRAAVTYAALLLLAPAAVAEGLPQPSSEVILSVNGSITVRNNGESADFDLAMLEAMPKVSFRTSSPWTEGGTQFEGVALKSLLEAVGATGSSISATALNDYAAPLPASDADVGAIIAYKVNGEYMSVRDKGPLWIVYPFDDKPELKTESVYSRCVWQLRSMTLTD